MYENTCAKCSYFAPVAYAHKIQDYCGICTHFAFYRVGMGHIEKDGSVVKVFENVRTRPPVHVVKDNLSKGNFWLETLLFKQRHRTCPHFCHPLSYLKEMLDKKLVDISILEGKLPIFKKFLENYQDHVYTKKMTPICSLALFGGEAEEPKEEWTQYNPCVTCQYFQPDTNEEGAPIPFKGKCTADSSSKGLFGIGSNTSDTNKSNDTLGMLSCDKHILDPRFKIPKDGVTQLSPKLVKFIETNNFRPPFEELQEYFRFPSSWKRIVLSKEEIDNLMATDQDANMLRMFNNNMHDKFDKDNHLQPIKNFFVRQVKKYGQKLTDFYDKYAHLKD